MLLDSEILQLSMKALKSNGRLCSRAEPAVRGDLDLLQMLPGVVSEDADDTRGHGCRGDAEESD
jgi:hypothetical protein